MLDSELFNQYYYIEDISKMFNLSVENIKKEIDIGNLKSIVIDDKIKINLNDFYLWKNNVKLKTQLKKDIVNYIDIEKEFYSIDAWNNKKNRTNYNFIDLFSGAGGLSCGLCMAGFNPVGSIEIMKEAVETYRYNFNKKDYNDSNVENRDIKNEKVKQDLINNIKNISYKNTVKC